MERAAASVRWARSPSAARRGRRTAAPRSAARGTPGTGRWPARDPRAPPDRRSSAGRWPGRPRPGRSRTSGTPPTRPRPAPRRSRRYGRRGSGPRAGTMNVGDADGQGQALHRGGECDRDHRQRHQVVDHRYGEDERAQTVRESACRPEPASRGERGVRGHRRAPAAAGSPPLIARKIRIGTSIPPSPATNGSASRRRSRRSPRSNSRRASSPTTKKNRVIRPVVDPVAQVLA